MGGDKLLAGVDGGGVYLLDLQARRAARYLSENEEFGGQLRGNGVYDLLPDGEHVWVATYTGGISLVDVSDKFCLISRTPFGDPGQSLGDNHVNAVLEDRDGDMWFATNHGVSLWRVRENRWSPAHPRRQHLPDTLRDDRRAGLVRRIQHGRPSARQARGRSRRAVGPFARGRLPGRLHLRLAGR